MSKREMASLSMIYEVFGVVIASLEVYEKYLRDSKDSSDQAAPDLSESSKQYYAEVQEGQKTEIDVSLL